MKIGTSLLERFVDDASAIRLRPTVAIEIRAKLAKQLARAVRPRLDFVRKSLRRLIADAQLLFVDETFVEFDRSSDRGARHRACRS
jgi:hypothetical protein